MQGFEELQRDSHRSAPGILKIGPFAFFVRLHGWLGFGERQAPPHVGVDMAVREMVNDLAHRPAALAIRSIKLRVAESGNRSPEFSDGIARIHASASSQNRGIGLLL